MSNMITNTETEPSEPLGVVVGRFQVPHLHAGHYQLLRQAASQSKALLVLVGDRAGMAPTPSNPIPAELRVSHVTEVLDGIVEALPEPINFKVAVIRDYPSDHDWSDNVDAHIEDAFPGMAPVMYHSRDSFREYYHGKYQTFIEINEVGTQSGTSYRSTLCSAGPAGSFDLHSTTIKHIDKRATYELGLRNGYILAANAAFPTAFGVVDMIIQDAKTNRFVGIKKNDFLSLHLPGGFCDPTSFSNEEDASRETLEEVGLVIDESSWVYMGSTNINDWRYRGEKHQIRSNIYFAIVDSDTQTLEAGDDAVSVDWYTRDQMLAMLNNEHFRFFSALIGENYS